MDTKRPSRTPLERSAARKAARESGRVAASSAPMMAAILFGVQGPLSAAVTAGGLPRSRDERFYWCAGSGSGFRDWSIVSSAVNGSWIDAPVMPTGLLEAGLSGADSCTMIRESRAGLGALDVSVRTVVFTHTPGYSSWPVSWPRSTREKEEALLLAWVLSPLLPRAPLMVSPIKAGTMLNPDRP